MSSVISPTLLINNNVVIDVCVPQLIPGRGFNAQISSEITSEFLGVTIEIQDQKEKFRRRRKKTAENKVLNRNHATQDRLGFSTSYFPLRGPVTRKGAILLQFLQ
ncbi:hypothetical protein [Oryza sativa Japonica Group]|uniref:Uncharacterized protein n=1 Tax=Oryza sativa subsp. japonica TaxID=39947 RepID=Q5Z8F3_ORYSJ|nr:hypothetical protein [Oryza sativa Japonica Group]